MTAALGTWCSGNRPKMTARILNSKLKKPVVWTPQLLVEHTKDIERQAREREKTKFVALAVFVLSATYLAAACVTFLPLVGWTFTLCLLASASYLRVRHVLKHSKLPESLAKRGWNLNLNPKFHNLNWKYYPNGLHGRFSIDCFTLLHCERKELIETCYAANAVVEFEDFKFKRTFDLAQPTDWAIVHNLWRKVLGAALELIPGDPKARTGHEIINEKLAMLTLKDVEGTPFRQPVLLVNKDTVIIDRVKGIHPQDFRDEFRLFKIIFENGLTDIHIYPQYRVPSEDGGVKEHPIRNYPQWGNIDEKNPLVQQYKATPTILGKSE